MEPLQPAFVLHRRAWRESSLLVELLTLEGGRVGVVARGARRRRGPLAACEPFVELQVAWRGRGELGQLVTAEPGGPGWRLHGDALFSGLYLNEVLLRLLRRHDPHPGLFSAYRETLAGLAAGAAVEPLLRRFERQLLDESGYGLLLTEEAGNGVPIEPAARYRYDLEHGPVRVDGAQAGGLVLSGASLLALADGELHDATVLAECKRLLRSALAPHLGPRPLRSRELFRRALATEAVKADGPPRV